MFRPIEEKDKSMYLEMTGKFYGNDAALCPRQRIRHRLFHFWKATTPPDAKRFRPEVEKENEGAVALYQRGGFEFFPYDQMKKDF